MAMVKKSRVTIKDVAKEAGVSVATVSYVFNDIDVVGAETRARVLQVAEKLGYRPHVLAKNLRSQRSHIVAYCWRRAKPDQWHPVMDRILAGLSESAKELGYYITPFSEQLLGSDFTHYDELFLSGRVDGFIVSNTLEADPRLRYLSEREFPFVSIGRSDLDLDFPYVDIDDEDGAFQVVEHLRERGHSRIGLVNWPLETSLTGRFREAGYRRALAEVGIPFDAALVKRISHEEHAARLVTRELMTLPEQQRPTAIFAVADFIAIGVLNALYELNLQPGRDVAVAGYDDIPTVQYFRPSLTTVRMPIYEVGQTAIAMLVKLINAEPLESRHILFKPKLIVRESSG
jgi:LacI family transcriptional regulator